MNVNIRENKRIVIHSSVIVVIVNVDVIYVVRIRVLQKKTQATMFRQTLAQIKHISKRLYSIQGL